MTYADRVLETTTTTGTGPITLAGAISGFRTFASAFRLGSSVHYTISDNLGNWEVGFGTYDTVLIRTQVITSSNSNALVDFPSGTKSVFVSQPASTIADMGMTMAIKQCLGGF